MSGKVSSGVISSGETIVALPSGGVIASAVPKSFEKPVDFAISGELTQMAFKTSQISNESVDQIRIGDLITKPGSPVKTAHKLLVLLHLFNMDKPLLVGTPFVCLGIIPKCQQGFPKLSKLSTAKKKKVLHLVSRQTAIVEIALTNALPVTKFDDNKVLGRIVIRRGVQLLAQVRLLIFRMIHSLPTLITHLVLYIA